ncbi:GntR family transcriptional regulator [Marinobacter sp. F3R08]|uniref:GntR family transcriptional regulator n=1 Tax=Marinobacter sp. F3R08 TaxID=2841559 RepID=UPI001C08E7C7|nr:GntR family transcriptional regulator [Marinobacter sp. F3R08]MBU2954273.1 GntR family transcriptional regulator [Marinobacter sp. F3R08]
MGTSSKRNTSKQQEVQRIFDALSNAIARHSLPPGTRLVEAEIVKALRANRNHVQAAIQRLALQSIVTIEPNRGAHVSEPSVQEARDVFEARRAVERGLVESITPEKMKRHAKILEAHMQSEHGATAGNDRRAIIRELCNFHRVLGKASENQVLSSILENLMLRSSLIVALYQRNDIPACQHTEHREILAALEAGDNGKAAELMLDHLNHLESELQFEDEGKPAIDLCEALALENAKTPA